MTLLFQAKRDMQPLKTNGQPRDGVARSECQVHTTSVEKITPIHVILSLDGLWSRKQKIQENS